MEKMVVTYDFHFPDETNQSYTIEIDKATVSLIKEKNPNPPAWTNLESNKCSHCPLNSKDFPQCPIALNLAEVVEAFSKQISFAEAVVKVTTAERIYIKKVSLQEGIFSIFGLIMATSSCPYMKFLKPLARFHLPFSTSEETIVRSVSMHLLKQYFIAKHGGSPDLTLQELEKSYKEITKVNQGILSRIRGLTTGDADANGLTILQNFSQLLTMAISNDLSKIEPTFSN